MNENINKTVTPPINLVGFPSTYLRRNDFDVLIAAKGYNIYLDKFIACPCKEKGTNSPRLTCQNCFGTGFFLSERIQTKAFLASMNRNTEYKDWSVENIGTVSITTLSANKVSFMDRVVLYEIETVYSQLVYPIYLDNGEIISFLDYPPINIEAIYLFNGDNFPLIQIDVKDIQIGKEGEIILTNIKDSLYERNDFIFNSETGISIKYTYMPSYHILDVTRNIIQSPVEDSTKKVSNLDFPFHSVGRASHLVVDRSNLTNYPTGMNINSKEGTSKTEQFQHNLNVDKEFCQTELV